MLSLIILSMPVLMGVSMDITSSNCTTSDRADMLTFVLPIIQRFHLSKTIIITDFSDSNVLSFQLAKSHVINGVILASNGNLSPPLKIFSKSHSQQRIIMWCITSCMQDIPDKDSIFTHKYVWLLVYSTNDVFTKDLAMLSIYIRPDSHVYAIIAGSNKMKNWIFVKLQYKKPLDSNTLFKTLAIIDSKIHWAVESEDVTPALQGFNFTATMFHWPPLSEVTRNVDGFSVKGIRYDLMVIFARYLGFKYEYEILYAKGDDNNHTVMTFWNKQRQILGENKVNMSGMFMPITLGDLANISQSSHIFSVCSAVVFNNIKYSQSSYNLFVYSKPFTSQVWMLVFLISAICIVLSFISTASCIKHTLSFRCIQFWYDWINLFIKDTLTSYPSQGYTSVTLPATSKKTFIVVLLLFTGLITITYSSVLISYIAAENYKIPYEVLEDMIDDGRFTFGTLKNSAMDFTITNSTKGVLFTMQNNSMYQTFPTMADGHQRIFQQHFAAILPIEFCTKLNCSYAFLKATYIPYDIAVNFPKNSPYVEIFSKFVMKMKSTGIMSKVVGSHTFIHRPQCELHHDALDTVNLSQCVLPFLILAAGVLVAMALLLTEIVIDKILDI